MAKAPKPWNSPVHQNDSYVQLKMILCRSKEWSSPTAVLHTEHILCTEQQDLSAISRWYLRCTSECRDVLRCSCGMCVCDRERVREREQGPDSAASPLCLSCREQPQHSGPMWHWNGIRDKKNQRGPSSSSSSALSAWQQGLKAHRHQHHNHHHHYDQKRAAALSPHPPETSATSTRFLPFPAFGTRRTQNCITRHDVSGAGAVTPSAVLTAPTRDVGAFTNLSVLCPASSPGGTVPHSWRNARCWRPCPKKTFLAWNDSRGGISLAGVRAGRVSGAKRAIPRSSGVRLGHSSSLCCAVLLVAAAILAILCVRVLMCMYMCMSVCVCVCVYPRPLLTVLRRFPQCGSDCGFESGCHDVHAGGAVRCSPVGCELMTGQLLLLPGAPAACVKSQLMPGEYFRLHCTR